MRNPDDYTGDLAYRTSNNLESFIRNRVFFRADDDHTIVFYQSLPKNADTTDGIANDLRMNLVTTRTNGDNDLTYVEHDHRHAQIDDWTDIVNVLSLNTPSPIKDTYYDNGVPVEMTYTSIEDAINQNRQPNTTSDEINDMIQRFSVLKFRQNPDLLYKLDCIYPKDITKLSNISQTFDNLAPEEQAKYLVTNVDKSLYPESNTKLRPWFNKRAYETAMSMYLYTVCDVLNPIEPNDSEKTIERMIRQRQLLGDLPDDFTKDDLNALIVRSYIVASLNTNAYTKATAVAKAITPNMDTYQVLNKMGLNVTRESYDNNLTLSVGQATYSANDFINAAFNVSELINNHKLTVIPPYNENYPKQLLSTGYAIPLLVKGDATCLNDITVNPTVQMTGSTIENKVLDRLTALDITRIQSAIDYQTDSYDKTPFEKTIVINDTANDLKNVAPNDTVVYTTLDRSEPLASSPALLSSFTKSLSQEMTAINVVNTVSDYNLLTASTNIAGEKSIVTDADRYSERQSETIAAFQLKHTLAHAVANQRQLKLPVPAELDKYVTAYVTDAKQSHYGLSHYINPNDKFDSTGQITRRTDNTFVKQSMRQFLHLTTYEQLNKQFNDRSENDPNYLTSSQCSLDIQQLRELETLLGYDTNSQSKDHPSHTTINEPEEYLYKGTTDFMLEIENKLHKEPLELIQDHCTILANDKTMSLPTVGDINVDTVSLADDVPTEILNKQGIDTEQLAFDKTYLADSIENDLFLKELVLKNLADTYTENASYSAYMATLRAQTMTLSTSSKPTSDELISPYKEPDLQSTQLNMSFEM